MSKFIYKIFLLILTNKTYAITNNSILSEMIHTIITETTFVRFLITIDTRHSKFTRVREYNQNIVYVDYGYTLNRHKNNKYISYLYEI